MYIKKTLVHNIEVEEVSSLVLLSTISKIDSVNNITGVYRCHNLDKLEFINLMKNYLIKNKNHKNYMIMGDFNIDLLNVDVLFQNYLYNFLEVEYMPLVKKITRPCDNNI